MPHALLLETDQTDCYNESGHHIPCMGCGQDGETNGARGDSPARFEFHGEVVTDRATGLRWGRDAGQAEFPMSWTEAFAHVAQLNRSRHLGIENWRLPLRRELFSLISHQHINPALPGGHPFTDVFSGYYWTASSCSRLPDQAWYIHLGGGRIYRGMKRNSYMVWPVAGPQSSIADPANRFLIEGYTAQDRLTQRGWMRPDDAAEHPVKWENAFETIDALNARNAGGHADWRLPNIRELESLVDLNRHAPALSVDHPFESVAEGYWSATTSVYEKRYAWVLYPHDGAVGVGYKPLPEFCVWAVRFDGPG